MGVQVHEVEYTSTVSAARLFKALIIDSDNLIPKIAPKAINKVEILEGDGGPGTIKKITFDEGASFAHVTHRVDSIDQENFSYAYSLIEGDVLTNKISKVEYDIELVKTAEGCLIKSISKYHTLGETDNLKDQINAGKEKALQLFKLIEVYLKDHPDLYN